jgi:16S rRNA (cytidine1402-2'-O)-methyltransferase
MLQKKEKTSSLDYPLLVRTLIETSGNDLMCKLSAGLYLVATPIGNLGDISLRALATLANADVIFCEDTRTSGVLLHAYGMKKTTLSYHDHNDDARRPEMIERMKRGEAVALISDAGMPVIADPGFKIVRNCRLEGIDVTVIPGPNAAVAALAGSGLASDQFHFYGFLPPKTVARQKEILSLKHSQATLVFYESPQRLVDCLNDLRDGLGASRQGAVARELTKLYEEMRRGTLGELADYYAAHPTRGEIVLIIEGKGEESEAVNLEQLLANRLQTLSLRDAVKEVAELTGVHKNEVYAKALMMTAKEIKS